MTRRMKSRFLAAGVTILATFSSSLPAQAEATKWRPNIILILADDLGYTDISTFGSEISTPNIASLAEEGISFTNYHTAASCAPTRAMLLTGVDSHRNGVPNIPEALPPEQKKHANYQGVLGDNVVTVATLLKESGYHTYMAGKWHLGKTPDLLPSARGFERTVAMADTGADNWEQKPYLPIYKEANWFADGEKHQLPDDFYSSKYFVDKTIEFIDENRADEKPFFAYIPFQAVHIPVQAPREFTEKYMDVYDEGWTVMRERRHQAAEALGIIPPDIDTVVTPGTGDWDALTHEEKRYQSKRMAVYAGMVDAMDMHIGRLIAYLKETGEYDNTIFIFTSDNGAEGSEPIGPDGNALLQRWMKKVGYNTDYETLGEKGSFNAIGPSNATVAASPLAFYKFYTGEGGMRVPLVMSGPGVSAKGAMSDALTFVTDITPTILGFARVANHGGSFNGKEFEPIIGKDLRRLTDQSATGVREADEIIGYELGGNRALFKGDYKIVFNRIPLGNNTWHLFNIAEDPGEAHDLAATDPTRLATMIADYEAWVVENNVLPVADDYSQVKQVFLNGMKEIYGPQIRMGAIAALAILGLGIFWIVRRRRRAV